MVHTMDKVGSMWSWDNRYSRWNWIVNDAELLKSDDSIAYRGWKIVRSEDDFERTFTIIDNNDWKRFREYPTLRKAVNAIDKAVDSGREA